MLKCAVGVFPYMGSFYTILSGRAILLCWLTCDIDPPIGKLSFYRLMKWLVMYLLQLMMIDRHQHHEKVASNLDDIVGLIQRLLTQSGVDTEIWEETIKCFQVKY